MSTFFGWNDLFFVFLFFWYVYVCVCVCAFRFDGYESCISATAAVIRDEDRSGCRLGKEKKRKERERKRA